MTQSILFDADLIGRHNLTGPRYTSYPTAPQFHERFDEAAYRRFAQLSNENGQEGAPDKPLSLYFHLPFCATICYYCACNKIVTRDHTRAAPYLERLFREIEIQGELFDRDRPVAQLHWGGGTPTFLDHEQMQALMAQTARHFSLKADDSGEYSIEIDPRCVEPDTIALLRQVGFNRMSIGVQDFEPAVQKAVNRVQSEDETRQAIEAARREGFKSVSLDLIYGLPHQSVASFERTLDKVLDIDPDRLSVYNYAHLPHLFKPQRRIDADALPSPADKLEILQLIIHKLIDAGYLFIGMDHFAKPGDELAHAQREGSLHRNFQGYSTHGECDLVAMGVTAISKIAASFSQNVRGTEEYFKLIDAGRLPVLRGLELDDDDLLRRAVITELMCHFRLDFAAIDARFGIRFVDYFADTLETLKPMAADGLLTLTDKAIEVTPAGRLLVRNICMAFDRYLERKPEQRFSKVI
ncbi:MAG: oxygen-independent coproporphyrinogen III oxidase [Sphingomonadales bacterium]